MSILDAAKGAVYGDRHTQYGHPKPDFERIAAFWSIILRMNVSVRQVGLCMIAVKMARLCHKYQQDSLIDIAGYAETIQMCEE